MTLGANLTFGEHQIKPSGRFHFAETHDIDDQAALLRGWNQTYAQMSSGPFAGSIAEAHIAGAQLFLEETHTALYQMGALPRGKCAVGVPIRYSGLATFCGAPCDAPAVHVFSGRDGFEFHTPGGLLMAGIVVNDDTLTGAFSAAEREAVLPSLAYAHLRRVTGHHAHLFRQLLGGVFDLLRDQPHLADNDALVKLLEHALISSLAQILIDDRLTDEQLIAPDRRWRIIAAARDLVIDQPDTPITITELCRTLGISRRALQYCFQDVLGIGPAAFLRTVRLDGARRALKSTHSVTEAAIHWGFWHFGRFAHDYKAMFGELPSETFRRYHGTQRLA